MANSSQIKALCHVLLGSHDLVAMQRDLVRWSRALPVSETVEPTVHPASSFLSIKVANWNSYSISCTATTQL